MPSDLISRFLGATDSELGIIQPTSGYHVYIRDINLARVGELTDWTSLHLVLRFNDVGTWELETSADSEGAALLSKVGGIIVTREIGGLESTIFSGSVSTAWSWTPTTFRAAGYSDDERLDVPCRPKASQAFGPFDDEYYVHTSWASDVMRTLIAGQIANAPWPWNAVPINLDPDPVLGGTLTARGRFQSVLVLLREIAATPIAGGLGFRLLQSDAQSALLRSDIYQPQDRSADAVFSTDLGTAADYSDEWAAPAGNYFYVLGGDGFGLNRTVVEGGDATSYAELGRYFPRVIDRRGSTDTGELQQALAEALASAVDRRRTAIVPFDVPSLQYGQDYRLGDIVTVVTKGGSSVDVIREVEIGMDAERGVVVIPTVGGDGSSSDDATVRHIASVQDRLSNLERNWTVPPDSIDRSMLQVVVQPPIGEIRWLATAAIPPGYLPANGAEVSRTTYALLFAHIGVIWGAGNGSTTFNLPNLLNRFPIGAGGSYPFSAVGGAASASIAGLAHTHPGHHSHTISDHSHTVADHSHTIPNHLHTVNDHSHTIPNHNHLVDIDHNHPSFNSGTRFNVAGTILEPGFGSGSTDHAHAVDVPALGNTPIGSGNQSSGGSATNDKTSMSTNNATGLVTNDKTGMVTADKTGMVTQDDTATAPAATYSGSSTVATLPPYVGLNPVIYAGV